MNFLTEQINESDRLVINQLVQENAKPNMVVFELGTYTGASSLVMLPHIQRNGGRLYCVDWFQGNPGVQAAITQSYHTDDVLNVLLQNLSERGFREYVTVMVTTTEAAAAITANGVADLIFIDADHRYSSVKRDLINWYPKLKPGGLMFGHDFEIHLSGCDPQRVREKCEEDYVDGRHYGVIRAVCEFFPDVRQRGRIWWARKGRIASLRRFGYRLTTPSFRQRLKPVCPRVFLPDA
jgi:predicted O-methyltransferase YrrM